jgi:hypothetical protein
MALATPHLTAGTAVFGLPLPQGQATDYVKVGSLNTQTDVRNEWPDGSIRFCVVSCEVPSDGNYDITAGVAATGSFTPTWPTASVALTISGTTYTATLPTLTTTTTHLAGPIAKEYRVKITPVNGATPHAALEVIFDVRSYAAGGHRLDVTVQNALDVTNNNAFTYDVVVTINGSSVFSKTGKTQDLFTCWRRTFNVGSPSLSTVTPDFEPFYTSYAFPRYSSTIGNSTWPQSDDLTHSRYDILEFGDMDPGMGNPGGRNELGPFPAWCAERVKNKDADSYAYMIRHAELSGSWTGSRVTKSNGDLIKVTDSGWEGYWLDGRAGTNPNGPNVTRGAFDTLQGQGDVLETNHIPNLTLLPYLETGDMFFIDQLRHWANFGVLWNWPGDGWRTYIPSGVTTTGGHLYQLAVRGVGWGLRLCGEAAALLPDGDPDKSYFTTITQNNLNFLDWVSTTLDPGGPLSIPMVSTATGGGTKLTMVTWQCEYLNYGIDRCHALGFTGGEDMKTQISTWRVRLFNSEPDFDRDYACPYWVPFPETDDGVGTQSSSGLNPSQVGGPTIPAGVSRSWYTMAQIFTGNMTQVGDVPNLDGPYGGEALMSLKIAIQLGLTNAQSSHDYLETFANPVHAGWELVGVNGSEDPPDIPASYTRRKRIRFRA